ncbi:MAG: FAD-dependent oxidoreductase [Desulfomonile sp.]|nr:FAD-dependent oxidoreductase [Desulfomonile sp.]
MQTDSLIIGGGIAGLWCARELSRLGLCATVVEKAPILGGHVQGYCCKATDTCQRCGACLLEEALADVQGSDSVTCLVRSEVLQLERANGGFAIKVLTKPERVDAQLEELSIETRSLVLATGFKPFDPTEKPRFGHGRISGVMTALELDELLRNGAFAKLRRGRDIHSVAFIQCVGSRDAKLGRNYCSRVCCGYAMRLARLLRSRFSDMQTAMFYMDLQTFDRDFEKRIQEAAREVRLVRAIPSEVRIGTGGRPELIYEGTGDVRVAEEHDLVVLSVGIHPNPAIASLVNQMGIRLNEDGFVGHGAEDVNTGIEGVFVAGTAQGPKSIADSVSHAMRAAGQVAAFLDRSGGRP